MRCIGICLIVRLILCRLNPNFYNFINQVSKTKGKKASFFFFSIVFFEGFIFSFLIIRPKQPRKAATFFSSVSPAFARPNENRSPHINFHFAFWFFFSIREGPTDLWKDDSTCFITRVYDMIFSHYENFKHVLNTFKFN